MTRNHRPPRSRAASAAKPAKASRGLHVGPLRITPVRATLVIALIGGLVFLAWSIFARDQSYQVPMMATGLAVCGIVLAVASALSLRGVVTAGREGRDGTAVLTALVGGLMAAAAMLLFAAAVIMSMIWSSAKTT
jgi:hypothetical protein